MQKEVRVSGEAIDQREYRKEQSESKKDNHTERGLFKGKLSHDNSGLLQMPMAQHTLKCYSGFLCPCSVSHTTIFPFKDFPSP